MAGAAAACLPTLRLTQVSLIARPRPRSVLLCVLAPYLSSTAQPDLRLHSVRGRRLPDATLEATFDGCPMAARAAAAWRRTVARGVNRDATAVGACVPGQGHIRGPDRSRSSILLPCAAWLVHPDPLPS